MKDNNKVARVLEIYTKLLNGELICKAEAACRYQVDQRSIQRDLDDIRCFFDNDFTESDYLFTVAYDRIRKGYFLEKTPKKKIQE